MDLNTTQNQSLQTGKSEVSSFGLTNNNVAHVHLGNNIASIPGHLISTASLNKQLSGGIIFVGF
jgi:hypothetical protein